MMFFFYSYKGKITKKKSSAQGRKHRMKSSSWSFSEPCKNTSELSLKFIHEISKNTHTHRTHQKKISANQPWQSAQSAI
jgi:hypothetical protein